MAPGWLERGIDRQRVETESAAQKALAIGGRHCPPTPRHSNSAEILPRSFSPGCSRHKSESVSSARRAKITRRVKTGFAKGDKTVLDSVGGMWNSWPFSRFIMSCGFARSWLPFPGQSETR
jgi:hypothetical protein